MGTRKRGSNMLEQDDVDYLLGLIKELSINSINFPNPGEHIELPIQSIATKDKFIIDVNRKGTINIKKCTFQTRYQKSVVLLRIDIEGSPHTNPDGQSIQCPHLHIFREGYGTSWAFPLSKYIPTKVDDLIQVLIDYLKYNNINNVPKVIQQIILI
jgi:hypothetical protein